MCLLSGCTWACKEDHTFYCLECGEEMEVYGAREPAGG
jgi:hypothetical protein